MKSLPHLKIISAALAIIALFGCAAIKEELASDNDPHFSNVVRAKAYYQNRKQHSVIVTLNALQRKQLSAWLAAHHEGWKPFTDEHHPIAKSDIIAWHDDGSAYTINMFSSAEWKHTVLIERDAPLQNITQHFAPADIESLRRILK